MLKSKKTKQIIETALTIHEKFYQAINKSPDFELTTTRQEDRIMKKFVELLDKHYDLKDIDAKWIYNFIESNWNLHFDNEKLVFGKFSIQLSWIFGEKAFLRYKAISNLDENVFAKRRKITHDLGLNIFQTIGDLKGSEFYRNSICLPKEDEEIEKGLFYNTIEGYYWCGSNTSLYNHRSMKCAFCNFQKQCKLKLKKTSPEVYKIRGYHE